VKRVHFLLVLLLAIVPVAWAIPTHAQPAAVPTSQEFAERASAASQFAIAASDRLLKRSTDRRVRKYAEQIIDDYVTGNAYISEAAASANLRIPDKLDADLQARLDRLENASPGEIDSLFMNEMSRMHGDAIPLFTAYARSGDNRSLRFLAGRALPTLREHYSNVLQLASR
jgi:putative membrane protein